MIVMKKSEAPMCHSVIRDLTLTSGSSPPSSTTPTTSRFCHPDCVTCCLTSLTQDFVETLSCVSPQKVGANADAYLGLMGSLEVAAMMLDAFRTEVFRAEDSFAG